MDDLRYIFNMPIEINQIGVIHGFTMEEYALPINSLCLNVLSVTINLYLQQIDIKEIETRAEIAEKVKCFDLICSQPELVESLLLLLKISFKPKKLFFCPAFNKIILVFEEIKEKTESKRYCFITRDNYDFVRNQIIKVNNIRLTKQANNKELQKWYDKSYKFKNSQNKNAGDMEDIITSVISFTGYTPEEVKKLTVYQVNKIMARLYKRSEYDTSIQFICVGAEKIKLEHWSSKIDEKDDVSSDFDVFASSMQSIIK